MKIDITKPARFSTFLFLFFTGVAVGGFFGAVTNMINGAISPLFYKILLNWKFDNIWQVAVLQGIYEGLIYGSVYSFFYVVAFGFLIRKKVSYLWAISSFKPIMFLLIIFWLLGGIGSVIMAQVNPGLFQQWVSTSSENHQDLLRFSWVKGSVWGGITGGLISVIYGAILLKKKWKEILALEDEISNITQNYS